MKIGPIFNARANVTLIDRHGLAPATAFPIDSLNPSTTLILGIRWHLLATGEPRTPLAGRILSIGSNNALWNMHHFPSAIVFFEPFRGSGNNVMQASLY